MFDDGARSLAHHGYSMMLSKIYRYDEASRNWRAGDTLSGHEDTVHDVAWAPSLGRGYQLIATACKDKRVRIYKLTERNVNGATNNDGDIAMGERGAATMGVMATTTKGNGGATGIGFETELVATFAEHEAEVWRVEWNITGTILASTGDDGRVMLWKGIPGLLWSCLFNCIDVLFQL